MKKNFFLFILLSVISVSSYSQNFNYDWLLYSDDQASEYYSNTIYETDVDEFGNTYYLMEYGSDTTLFYYIDTVALTIGGRYLLKLSPDGHALWAKKHLLSYFSWPRMYIDNYGNIYILAHNAGGGFVWNGSWFYPQYSDGVVLAKYDQYGNEQFITDIGITQTTYQYEITSDQAGNIYIFGRYAGTISMNNTTIMSNPGDYDGYILKLDTIGNLLSSKTIQGINTESVSNIQFVENNIFISAFSLSPSCTFNGLTLFSNSGSNVTPIFLKYDQNFNLLLIDTICLGGSLIANSCFATNGDIYGTSYFYDSMIVIGSDTLYNNSSQNSNELVVARFDSLMNPIWAFSTQGLHTYNAHQIFLSSQNDLHIAIKPAFTPFSSSYIIGQDTFQLDNPSYVIFILDSSGQVKFVDIPILKDSTYFLWPHLKMNATGIYISDEVFYSEFTFGMDTFLIDSPPVYWDLDFIFCKIDISFPEPTKQFIDLLEGWSIISTYIDADFPNFDSVFSEIDTNLIIMKDEAGLVYWPLYNINNIGDLSIGEGYQVKMDTFKILEVAGIPVVPETTPVNLLAGWNILGYLRQNSGAIDTILTGISQNIIMAKSGVGLVYWPLYGINNIGNMNPGEGYQIKMLASDTLLYPPN
ncbi:MAG: hypothetical protein HN704_06750 [Bacteroidetes bacterium]|nr:hypothetical protein [Bacteroidota bacterium]MBT6686441.1 hypothetical protein [Bacteroidota bacterium]MBT7144680.1 hypothetical protein [Bacteroidota bacterium]MBT7491285.1 hypothetical protein [Bacteroidota bacterium]